ncbi:MAG TPA: glycosyltransferase family 1 protein [Solirubrobacteraceae bacterium]|jgi:glycosyltransferase involved in cell wall biosynthesis
MAPIVIDARDVAAAELRGWGRYTRELVAALRAQPGLGLELMVLAGGGRGPELLFEQVGLPRILRRRSAALVHAPNCFLPLLRPCPGVVTIHDLAFEAWPQDFAAVTAAKFKLITPLAARSAQRIICPSRFTADDVCRRYRVDPGKIRVIAEAPALALGGRAGSVAGGRGEPVAGGRGASAAGGRGEPATGGQPGEPYVLAVGDLRAKKNLAALVRAFVALRRRGAGHRLVLAGVDAGEGPWLRELAGGEPVQLTGYVSDARLDALLAGAELLVHPSLYEGFGLVVLEAMARGTPVLAARATALPETGGDAAEYFDPHDPRDLPRRLEALLQDAARRAELARRGLARAAQFSWEQTARATAEVYRELL